MRARLLAAWTLPLLLVLQGCGGAATDSSFFGSAGVRNGTLVGSVLGLVGGVSGPVPLEGVTVIAERQTAPFQIRTTFTDPFGEYFFGNLPLGRWTLRFQALGFAVDEPSTLSVFVDNGGFTVAPDFVMIETAGVGSGNVTLRVVDAATGTPVTGATVTVGGFPASSTGFDGTYFFQVPVSLDPFTGLPQPLPISVSHPSFPGTVPTPSAVTPVVGAPVQLTVALDAFVGQITGILQSSTLNTLYLANGSLAAVTISSPQIPQSTLLPVIDPDSGFFSVEVPSSLSGGVMDLDFTSPLFQGARVSNILVPNPGQTRSLSSPVTLVPRNATLNGTVVDSGGVAPSGAPNQVVIVETGQAATPFSGSYSFFGVPAGISLTLRATVQGPFGVEQGQVTVTPLAGGSFQVPTIVTGF